jgi:hypothetical protein
MEYLPRDEPFQAREDLFVAEPLTSAPLCVGACGLGAADRRTKRLGELIGVF